MGDTDVVIGHWTAPDATTGCSVIIFPEGSVASGEVRGGAPASREFALLDPRRMVQHVDAVVLTGGSAFGLAVADGVMTSLAERGKSNSLKEIESLVLAPGQVSYTRQQEPLGLGHAVWCARHLVGKEPFAVLLADDLILSQQPCLAQADIRPRVVCR